MTSSASGSLNGKVQVTRDPPVTLLILNCPPANAIDALVLGELATALDKIERDRDVGAVIITGAGPKMFSAGADINVFVKGSAEEQERLLEMGMDLFDRIEGFPKPVIAAVNGLCLGGANELAMACDIRIASAKARFGQPEINLGLIPGWAGIPRLNRLIGKSRARELLLMGGMLEAEEAKAAGLVTRVVPDEALMAEAHTLATRLAKQAPLAVAETKRLVAMDEEAPLGEVARQEVRSFLRVLHSRDGKEGVAAFFEKRPPRFLGE